ncbi:hypothetical protein BHE74_00027898 [Ensete ventricosum]|nr:hypothetical protein BHE74_00027898 [Ensete ventricosum]
MVREQQQHDGQSASYYAVLGIGRGASLAEVRSAYRKLAMLKKKSILVRSVLSDEKRRKLYDAGLYDPLQEDEEEVEVITDKRCNNIGVTTNTGRKSTNFEGSSLNSLQGFGDFVQEMVSLMASVRKEVILILMYWKAIQSGGATADAARDGTGFGLTISASLVG